jgi:hypothetical protein
MSIQTLNYCTNAAPVEGTEALAPRILGLPLDPALSPLIGTITVRNES